MTNVTKKLTVNIFDEDVFNEYGVDGEETLQEELAQTIQNLANTQKIKTKLEINIVKPENSTIDNNQFVEAYKNTFKANIERLNHEKTRCILTGAILLFIGIAMLAMDIFIFNNLNFFVYEFFNVFSWVFCWGGIEVLTIELTQLIIEINKEKRLLNSKLVLSETHNKTRRK